MELILKLLECHLNRHAQKVHEVHMVSVLLDQVNWSDIQADLTRCSF